MKTLIKNGRVINPNTNTDEMLDICIEDGVIKDIAPNIDISAQVIDASGLVVAPGLVDMHCHLRDPGYEYKEDIESGTLSAAAGGFTSVACMPNTSPVADNLTVISYIINRAQQVGSVHVFPIGAITLGLEGEHLAPIGELKFAGAIAVSDDGKPVMDGNIMKNAMIYANMFDIPVISHCEDLNLVAGGVINDGVTATTLGLRGITPAAENVMVAREIVLSETTGTPVHIAHVSTVGAIELLRDAKKRGVKVTCETCPHYFSLDESACDGFNTLAKMNPPLRTSNDIAAVKQALADGTIDAIATDHAPHHSDEKDMEFELAPNGIIGFETALSLSLTHLFHTGDMTLMQVIRAMTSKPAKILRLNKGELKVGGMADVCIFNPDEKRIVTSDFLSRASNSPFIGAELFGVVKATIVAGKIIFGDTLIK